MHQQARKHSSACQAKTTQCMHSSLITTTRDQQWSETMVTDNLGHTQKHQHAHCTRAQLRQHFTAASAIQDLTHSDAHKLMWPAHN